MTLSIKPVRIYFTFHFFTRQLAHMVHNFVIYSWNVKLSNLLIASVLIKRNFIKSPKTCASFLTVWLYQKDTHMQVCIQILSSGCHKSFVRKKSSTMFDKTFVDLSTSHSVSSTEFLHIFRFKDSKNKYIKTHFILFHYNNGNMRFAKIHYL